MHLVLSKLTPYFLISLIFFQLCCQHVNSAVYQPKMLSTPELIKKSSDIVAKIPLLISTRGGFMNGFADSDEDEDDEVIEVVGCPNTLLNGAYTKAEDDINGYPHYERAHSTAGKVETFHMYWSGNQWIIHKVSF
jgi:hypothetical protein